jgi:hypothetical protein
VFTGADLNSLLIPAADTGVLALGVRIDSPDTTGIRLGSSSNGSGVVFVTYATLDVPDTASSVKLRTFTLASTFNSYVMPPQPEPDSTFLAVGGEPSARTILRFALPPVIRDSASIVRATLELTPVTPFTGLPTDPAHIQARPVVTDVGAKSPVSSVPGGVPTETLDLGATSVSLEAVRLVELWVSTTRPSSLFLSFAPEAFATDREAASFSRPVFYSTRAADPAVRPRLRISYLRRFPFENP